MKGQRVVVFRRRHMVTQNTVKRDRERLKAYQCNYVKIKCRNGRRKISKKARHEEEEKRRREVLGIRPM
jgi:hypothetical protein